MLPIMSEEELTELRWQSNQKILESLTEYEHGEKMHAMTLEDASKGWMTRPEKVTKEAPNGLQ